MPPRKDSTKEVAERSPLLRRPSVQKRLFTSFFCWFVISQAQCVAPADGQLEASGFAGGFPECPQDTQTVEAQGSP